MTRLCCDWSTHDETPLWLVKARQDSAVIVSRLSQGRTWSERGGVESHSQRRAPANYQRRRVTDGQTENHLHYSETRHEAVSLSQRPRHTHSPTYIQTDRQTYRQTDRQTYRHIDRHTHSPTYIHTDRQTYRQTDRQTNIQTYRQTYTQPYIHTYRQTDRQTYRHIDRHTHSPTDRQTDMKSVASLPYLGKFECSTVQLYITLFNASVMQNR